MRSGETTAEVRLQKQGTQECSQGAGAFESLEAVPQASASSEKDPAGEQRCGLGAALQVCGGARAEALLCLPVPHHLAHPVFLSAGLQAW